MVAALDAGYTPVDFLEHTRVIDALAGRAANAQAAAAETGAVGQGAPLTAEERDPGIRLLRAVNLTKAALELPAASHGANIYSRATLMFTMATLYAELGDYANAVGSAGRAIAANPLSAHPYILLRRISLFVC